jgi:hypothetical protein
MVLSDQCYVLAALSQGKGLGTHWTGSWMDPGPVCTGVEKLAPRWGRTPNIQACRVAIPTMQSLPFNNVEYRIKVKIQTTMANTYLEQLRLLFSNEPFKDGM